VRRHRKTDEQEINLVSGKYLHDFSIALTFTLNKKTTVKVVDFLPLFQRHVKGDNLRYFAPNNFKKFNIAKGNISWGKNEDVIFPATTLLASRKLATGSDQVIYVI